MRGIGVCIAFQAKLTEVEAHTRSRAAEQLAVGAGAERESWEAYRMSGHPQPQRLAVAILLY